MNRPLALHNLLTAATLLALALSPALALGATAPTAPHVRHAAAATTQAAVPAPKLQAALRGLWHGHVVQTRAYALAVQDHNTTRADQAAEGVVANAKQLADAVGSYYGPAAGQQMLTLLAGHWGAVKAMTDAQARGDNAVRQAAMATLTANAAEIAKFLSGANPYLAENAVNGLLVAHGAHHAAQIQQVMAGDMQAEAVTWKAMQAHMDTLADALTGAIARQFPRKAS